MVGVGIALASYLCASVGDCAQTVPDVFGSVTRYYQYYNRHAECLSKFARFGVFSLTSGSQESRGVTP